MTTIEKCIRDLSDKNYAADGRFPRYWKAADDLSFMGPAAAAPAVPTLIKLLKSSDIDLRWNSAYALSNMGSVAVSAVPALITALNDSHAAVRAEASKALQRIAPHLNNLIT